MKKHPVSQCIKINSISMGIVAGDRMSFGFKSSKTYPEFIRIRIRYQRRRRIADLQLCRTASLLAGIDQCPDQSAIIAKE